MELAERYEDFSQYDLMFIDPNMDFRTLRINTPIAAINISFFLNIYALYAFSLLNYHRTGMKIVSKSSRSYTLNENTNQMEHLIFKILFK